MLAPAEWISGWLRGGLIAAGLMAFGTGVGTGWELAWRYVVMASRGSFRIRPSCGPKCSSASARGRLDRARCGAISKGGMTAIGALEIAELGRSAGSRTLADARSRTYGVARALKMRRAASRRADSSQDAARVERRAEGVHTAVRVHLHTGAKIDIPTSSEEIEIHAGERPLFIGSTGSFGVFAAKARQMTRDIDERVRDHVEVPPPTSPLVASLLRGAQSLEQWRSAIDAAAPTTGDAYRGSEGSQEALWRLVEDETAPREARAGAALALRRSLDEDGRARIRLVSEACASPKLRVALETAADAASLDERLVEALREASLPRAE